jgi:hemoglobin
MTSLRTQGAYTPTPEDTPWHRLGGSASVTALAQTFYDVMEETEPALAAIHRQDAPGKVAQVSRDRFALFLVGWLGGPQDYQATHGHPRLRMRHAQVVVDTQQRDAWVRAMQQAMNRRGIDGEVRSYLDVRFNEVATFLLNHP